MGSASKHVGILKNLYRIRAIKRCLCYLEIEISYGENKLNCNLVKFLISMIPKTNPFLFSTHGSMASWNISFTYANKSFKEDEV